MVITRGKWKRLPFVVVVFFVAVGTTQAVAEQDGQVALAACCDASCGCAEGGCNSGCCGEAVCCPKCVTEEVKKHCWLVKPELVCVPGFRWPWECRAASRGANCGSGVDCCAGDGCCGCLPAPKCGYVRCVNVLEKHETTCEKCGYEWEAKCIRSGNRCCPCGDGCCPNCGTAAAELPGSDIELASAEVTPIETPRQESNAARFGKWLLRK